MLSCWDWQQFILLCHCMIFAQVATALLTFHHCLVNSGSNQVNGYFQWVNPKDRKVSKMESCGKEAL